MPTHIALVADQKEDIDIYAKRLQKPGVALKVVPSFKQLEKILSSKAYNGIIVDLKTKLSLPREQKALAYKLLDHYPVMQARVIAGSQRIQTLPFGRVPRDISLSEFLADECPRFRARPIRSGIRKRLHLHILLSRTGSFTITDLERAVTANVSRKGCFIISTSDWARCSSVAFIIQNLSVKTPIVGEIQWSIPWGRMMKMPGIGVRFEDIQSSQLDELTRRYHL